MSGVRDFAPRAGHPKTDPETLVRWMDTVSDRQNIDMLNPLALPAPGDETYIFDVSAGKTLKATLANILGITGIWPYDIGFQYVGAPTASLCLLRMAFARAFTFAIALAPSHGIARVAATAQTDLDVQKNASSVGTIRWAISGTVPTFIAASAVAFAVGDVLEVFAPASPDATLANIGVTLSGLR